MATETRDPQTQTSANAAKAGVGALATLVAYLNPELDAAVAMAAFTVLTMALGSIGSAARDWAHEIAPEKGGFVLWALGRLG